ncbi:MYG1 [Culex quinquefasciatus]|uniref:MYG1 n=1 Tax=Culex quinquefasciatus TaxID=7176 RepID=B0X5A8_CULQU|nr:MYG1 [Culex quinquefasciatus]|eukprot:XP_001864830.1 MYG1 [Culex quinquefasciatus]
MKSLLIFALLVLLTVDGGSRLMAHSAAEDELNVEVEGEDAPLHSVESDSQFELPAGYPFEFLVGFDNKGSNDFIMETVQALFRYPMDFNYLLQNFWAIANNREIKLGHEATFPDTVSIIKVDEGLDGKTFLLCSSSASGSLVRKAVFDPAKNRYDHHQASFQETLNSLRPEVKGVPKYTSTRVRHFNPAWNATADDVEDVAKRFEKAKAYVAAEFINKVLYNANRWWSARAIVEKAVRNRVEVHFCPCKEHLYELENEHGIGGLPKYVIYFKRPNDWRVICVPLETASFVCRKRASTGETGRVRVALQIAVVSLEEKEE